MLIFAIELISLYKLTGDPFFKYTTMSQYLLDVNAYFNYFGRLSFPKGLFHYPYIILADATISYFYILIFIAIIYLLKTKRRGTYTPILWFFPLLLYLSFGSASFSHYIPFRAVSRYLSVITIPGILLLAFFLLDKNKFIVKIVKPLSLIVLLIASLIASYSSVDNGAVGNLKALYPYIKNSKKIIYADSRSKDVLGYLSGYANKINVEPYPKIMSKLNDVYIIINKPMLKAWRESDRKIRFPSEIDNPPKNWEIIEETGKDEENKAIVYYAP
jgi:hypothetical protein